MADVSTTGSHVPMAIEELMSEFQLEYEKRGSGDMLYQVPYLSGLAESYAERHDWPSLLKAHALFNSCAVRDKENRLIWEERAYQIQVKYWQTNLHSFPQHQQVAMSLKQQLEEIRGKRKEQAERIADFFCSLNCEPDKLTCEENQELYDQISEEIPLLSSSVNKDMINFTGSVVEKALILCGPVVCKFCAVALGSMAKGETTPYSDLEFLFLIEFKSDEVTKYFQRLAVTMYFLIGNLGETKLKYMAIHELMTWSEAKNKYIAHWFDDAAMNGFKIDGLGSWAGNIPSTGEGTGVKNNRFICTVEELALPYKSVLNKPDPAESLKGDLTAMLANTEPVFGDRSLHATFRSMIGSYQVNEEREAATRKMLKNDIENFSFMPDFDLIHVRQLKPDIYRYPSILILNLKILHNINSSDPWQIIILLQTEGVISHMTAKCLRFSLACALFIRLSAYFYHNSQNDSISVLSSNPDSNAYKGAWYVRPELLLHMFVHLAPLKAAVSEVVGIPTQTINVETTTRSTHETVAIVRYYSDEASQVLSVLAIEYPDGLDSADSSIQQLYIHSAIECNHNAEAEHLLTERILSERYNDWDFFLLGKLHRTQSQFLEALDCYETRFAILLSLDSLTDHNLISMSWAYQSVGIVLSQLGLYKNAEMELGRSLALRHKVYDGKDHVYIASVLCTLGVVLKNQNRCDEALVLLRRCLAIRMRIFGNCDHEEIALILNNIGTVLDTQRHHEAALAEYMKCLQMYRRLYGEKPRRRTAEILSNIGSALYSQGMDADALVEYKKSLDMYVNVLGPGDHMDVASVLCNIGAATYSLGQVQDALAAFGRSLRIYINIFGENGRHPHIALLRRNIARLRRLA